MRDHLTCPSLPGTRGRVLLVEDDRNSGEALCELLSFLGYACQWSRSGESAYARLTECDVPNDVMILDLNLHHPDEGVELVRRARSKGVQLPPILLFSALNADLLDRVSHEIGADAVLRKPSGGDEICEAIEAAMASRAHSPSLTPH